MDACKALNATITEMNIQDFEQSFGTSETRRNFLQELKELIKIIEEGFTNYKIIVYGSFITDKETPSDIDVIVEACAGIGDKGIGNNSTFRKVAPPNVHVFTARMNRQAGPAQAASPAIDLVDKFNKTERNIKNGITCREAIEIIKNI